MLVYRLCNEQYKNLDGEGARLYGGRWNSVGISVVYTSEHLSLCVLEQLAHLNIDTIPLTWVALKIEIPDKIKGEKIGSAPKGENEAKKIGDEWANKNKSLFLKVPSFIIPSEYNILINPLHPKIMHVKIIEITPFSIDRRLLKKQ